MFVYKRHPHGLSGKGIKMILNNPKIDAYIKKKGFIPLLSSMDWEEIFCFVVKEIGREICFSYRLITQINASTDKRFGMNFPERIKVPYQYLYDVQIVFIPPDKGLETLIGFLNKRQNFWKYIYQYDPDTSKDEVYGIQIVGYKVGVE